MFTDATQIFNTNSPTFKWTAPTTMTFECSLDNERFRQCGRGRAGQWRGNNVPDGSHNLRVRGTDSDGHELEVEIRGWTVDTIAPIITFTSAPEKTNDSPLLAWRSSEEADFECSLDRGPYENCRSGIGGRWSKNNVRHGPHSLSVRGRDSAGNMGTTIHTWNVGKVLKPLT